LIFVVYRLFRSRIDASIVFPLDPSSAGVAVGLFWRWKGGE
jgi:hypothetical protein